MKISSFKAAVNSIECESNEATRLLDYLDKGAFSKAVDLLCASHKIIACASGNSGIAAKKFAHCMCCIERDGICLVPSEAIHGGLGCVKKEDCVVFISRGGHTAELFPILDTCIKKGASIISITENLDSPIAKASDVVLRLNILRESDSLNIMATSSFIATVVMLDALLSAMIVETDYSLEQFALIHPGGAVGKALN